MSRLNDGVSEWVNADSGNGWVGEAFTQGHISPDFEADGCVLRPAIKVKVKLEAIQNAAPISYIYFRLFFWSFKLVFVSGEGGRGRRRGEDFMWPWEINVKATSVSESRKRVWIRGLSTNMFVESEESSPCSNGAVLTSRLRPLRLIHLPSLVHQIQTLLHGIGSEIWCALIASYQPMEFSP